MLSQKIRELSLTVLPAVIILFVCILTVMAQSLPFVGFEAEQSNLSGGASTVSDTNASNGTYVGFFEQTTPGPVGQCGLAGEVFCENFEGSIATNRLRTGDWNGSKFSAARLSGGDNVNWVDNALIPTGCRPGSVTDPLPPDDTLICTPTAIRNSRHGLTATTVQNYGDNQYRINQPFDFANRTGIFQFDADIHRKNDGLLGTAVITLSDLPYSSTSIATENGNGAPPRNGLILHFSFFCRGDAENTTLPAVRLISNYGETMLDDSDGGYWDWCDARDGVKTREGYMNRIQLRVSQNRLEVWSTDYSPDGVNFGVFRKMYVSPQLNLPFTRGYWYVGGHNHASIKYQDRNNNVFIPSINTYWDNIAFDGPALPTPRTYQIPHNTTASDGGVRLGHAFYNRADQIMPALSITGVDKSGATSASLSFNSWILTFWNELSGQKLYYRLNGGAWHRVEYSPAMVSAFAERQPYRLNHVIPVDITELVNGNNTLQFGSDDMNHSYQSYVTNVDLQLN